MPVVPPTPAPTPTPARGAPEFSLENFDFDQEEKPAAAAAAEGAPVTPAPDATLAPATPETQPTSSPEDEARVAELTKLLASGGLPHDIESAFLRTSRGRQILNQFKSARQLELPPDQGGIGMVPTADQIREMYQAQLKWDQSQFEFQTNPLSWLRTWLSPGPQGELPQAAPALAEEFLPELLRLDRSGQLFEAAATPVLSFAVSDLRSLAAGIPEGQNPDSFGVDERTRILDAAAILEYRSQVRRAGAGGPGIPIPTLASAPTPTTAPGSTPSPRPNPSQALDPTDPLAAERARLEFQRRQYESQSAAILESRLQTVRTAVDTGIRTAISQDLDNLFAQSGIRNAMPSPQVYDLFRQNYVESVIESVAGNTQRGKAPLNPDGFQRFRLTYSKALQSARATATATNNGTYDNQQNPVLQQAVADFRQLARTAIRNLAPDAIKAAGVKIQESVAPAAAIQKLVEAAQHTEPAASGPAIQHSLAPQPTAITLQPGESRGDAFARVLAGRMTQAQAGRR